jgi:hypothetical protein
MHNPLLREPLTLEHIKPRLLGLKWTPLSRPKFGLDKL